MLSHEKSELRYKIIKTLYFHYTSIIILERF